MKRWKRMLAVFAATLLFLCAQGAHAEFGPAALPTQPGENQLRIEVATNLERAYQAMDVPKFSMQRPSAVKKPSSLIGTAALWTQK